MSFKIWRLGFVSFSSVEQGQIQEIKNVPEENWTFDGKYEERNSQNTES